MRSRASGGRLRGGCVCRLRLHLSVAARRSATGDFKSRDDRFMDPARAKRAAGRELRHQHRWVPAQCISDSLTRAVLVAEDSTVREHDGIDLEQIQKSFEINLEKERCSAAVARSRSNSRRISISRLETPLRKLRELLITRRLEAELSKRRILELYLNLIEWGDGIWVPAAARAYFGQARLGASALEAACRPARSVNPRFDRQPVEPSRRGRRLVCGACATSSRLPCWMRTRFPRLHHSTARNGLPSLSAALLPEQAPPPTRFISIPERWRSNGGARHRTVGLPRRRSPILSAERTIRSSRSARPLPWLPMLNYTERVTALMRDLVGEFRGCPSSISMRSSSSRGSDAARPRSLRHLSLRRFQPASPATTTGAIPQRRGHAPVPLVRHTDAGRHDRRSEHQYLISLALPRFCDQVLSRTKKRSLYPTRRLDRETRYVVTSSITSIRTMSGSEGREGRRRAIAVVAWARVLRRRVPNGPAIPGDESQSRCMRLSALRLFGIASERTEASPPPHFGITPRIPSATWRRSPSSLLTRPWRCRWRHSRASISHRTTPTAT